MTRRKLIIILATTTALGALALLGSAPLAGRAAAAPDPARSGAGRGRADRRGAVGAGRAEGRSAAAAARRPFAFARRLESNRENDREQCEDRNDAEIEFSDRVAPQQCSRRTLELMRERLASGCVSGTSVARGAHADDAVHGSATFVTPPPISTSSPRETTTSRPWHSARNAMTVAAALLLTLVVRRISVPG